MARHAKSVCPWYGRKTAIKEAEVATRLGNGRPAWMADRALLPRYPPGDKRKALALLVTESGGLLSAEEHVRSLVGEP